MKKKVKYLLWSLVICFSMTGCSEDDALEQIANVVQSEDENVLAVKNGSPYAYPDKTYGEAFENFFASPTWEYFVGTKEGPDEDGDGKPDYTEDNIDIVEFTGYCTYQDVEVKALMQFTLDKDAGSFEATYLSFNDVPQNSLMIMGLIEAAFTDGDLEADKTENQEETVDDDVPSPDAFVGKWQDTYSERCNMEITYDNGFYGIDINWSSGASENTHWSGSGTYDSEKQGIYYWGDAVQEVYMEDGSVQETFLYSSGDGLVYFGADGMLYWDDYVENAGADCCFARN